MTKAKRKDERFDIRLSASEKELLRRAAHLRQKRPSDYVRNLILEDARRCVEDTNVTRLSDRDRDLFLKVMENPPELNDHLKSALQEYKDKYQ